jgi:hypothetical protein
VGEGIVRELAQQASGKPSSVKDAACDLAEKGRSPKQTARVGIKTY